MQNRASRKRASVNSASLNIAAQSYEHLNHQLAAIDISVPLHTEGRAKEHRERYMMARLLSTLGSTGRLSFPLRVEHREKPDFALNTPSGSIGVECVQVTSPEWEEIQVLRERESPDALIFTPMLRPGQASFTLAQRREIARGDRAGTPWVGNMAERHWAAAQAHFIALKTRKLRAGNYAEFAETWLLIQDEWPVPIHYPQEYEEAARLCVEQIAEQLTYPCFARIFAANSRWLIELAPPPARIQPILDIWEKLP